jgi:hypothetical protein
MIERRRFSPIALVDLIFIHKSYPMQRLTTLTTTIGTITAITCLAPLATWAATPIQEPIADAVTPADLIVPPLEQLPKVRLAATPAIASPESIAQMDSTTDQPMTIAQVPAANFPTASPQVWTIETTPVQSLPSQVMAAPVTTATQPVWTESAMNPNADVAKLDSPLTPEIAPMPNDPAAGELTAQLPSEAEAAALRDQIENYQPAPQRWLKRYKASPGITLGVPSGYGADRGKIFTGLGIQRTPALSIDGSAGIGIGLGNARKSIGVQLSYTAYSLTDSVGEGSANGGRPVGGGGFNLKLHRQFPGGWSVAVGADSIVNIGRLSQPSLGRSFNEAEGTYYGAVTKLIPLKPDATASFSRLAVTVGAGVGRFQTAAELAAGQTVITPFASAALKISPAASVIAEWSGQDFGVGLSWVPFRNLPIVISPGIRDLFGRNVGKPRWQFGIGLSL